MNIKKLKAEIEKREVMLELKKIAFIKKYFHGKENDDIVSDLQHLSIETFNEIYLQTFNNTKRINIFYGGSGSGKSEYIARRYILKFLLEEGHNGLFLRKYGVDVRKSIYKLLVKVLIDYLGDKFDKYVKVNKSDLTFTFYNGNQILLHGLDDTEKIKSITFEQGILTDIWFEECSQGTGQEIKELNRRLRGQSTIKKEIVLSFNPVSKLNWVYMEYFNLDIESKKFYEDKQKLILKTTVYDNKYATIEDIEQLEQEKDSFEREIYLHGNFGVLNSSDTIINFANYMECINNNITDEGEIYIGLDCAGMGDDNTVAKVRKGAKELPYGFVLSKAEEQEVIEKLEELMYFLWSKYQKDDYIPTITLNIDTTGIGYGVGSQIRTKISRGQLKNVECNSISFGGNAKNTDRYFNLVTEMYFEFSERLKSKKVSLLKDLDTINETCSRKYEVEEHKNRRRIEEKSKFKKRIGKSPDKADAIVMAFYIPPKRKEGNIYEIEF